MTAIVRRGALFALTALSLALPATARAQSETLAALPDSTPVVVPTNGPTTAAAAVAVQSRAEAPGSEAALQARAGLGQPRALMVVGLGALIAGALIGGTPGQIIMIGGAVVGLYGLYQYLQ